MKNLAYLAAAITLAAAPRAHALDEVITYAINDFGSNGAAYCGSSSLSSHTVHTSTAAAFRAPFSALRTFGFWDDADAVTGTSVTSPKLSDSSKIASGADGTDHAGADDADVFYIHTHGSHVSSGASQYSSLVMGSSSSPVCSVRTDSHMKLGGPVSGAGSDADIAVIKACQSADYDVFVNGGYFAMVTTGGSQRMWNGFHGDSSCGGHVTSYVSSYAAASFAEGVGENWLDVAYDDDSGADTDDCPVSIVFGDTRAKREALYEHGGFLDRKDTGTKTAATYWYFRGCDPSNGRVLP
jgi:hypothetical protein